MNILGGDTFTQHIMALTAAICFVIVTATAAYLTVQGHAIPNWIIGILGLLFGSGIFQSGQVAGVKSAGQAISTALGTKQ